MAASGFTPIQLYYSTTPTNVPLAANLNAGELAINTADGKLYYKNVSGVVTLLAGLSGFSGTSGYSGASGFSGSGVSGFSGSSGFSGASGFSGISGSNGVSGFSGASGISGYSGISVSGFSGFSGFSGATGAGGSGTSGTSGYSGFSGFSGAAGATGATGATGASGFSGYSGFNGLSGFSGFSGTTGASGFSGFSGATGPTAYPAAGIGVSTGSSWGASLAVPVQVGSGGTGLTAVTAGLIPFGSSASQLSSSSLFNWSTANVRLGVGIVAPTATLHVRGGNSNNVNIDNDGSQFTTLNWFNNGGSRAQAYYDASNLLFVFGTDVAAPLIFKANGTEGMRLSNGGGVSIGTATAAGANNLLVNGSVTASSFSGGSVACSSASISSGAPTLWFYDSDEADFAVHVNNNLWYVLNGSGSGIIYTDSSGNFTAAGNIAASSDERLKSDIQTITNALDIVNQLRGTAYIKDGKAQIGVIAQEVQKVLPQVVQENAEGYLSVAYGNIVAVLIEAVKELTEKVNKLESKE